MTEKLIHIDSRSDKRSKNNVPYLLIQDGQSSYSCWEQALFAKLVVGSNVNCRMETNGKYTNILDILPDDGQSIPTKPVVSPHVQELLELTRENNQMLKDLIGKLAELPDVK